jgi:hypothetical protein
MENIRFRRVLPIDPGLGVHAKGKTKINRE